MHRAMLPFQAMSGGIEAAGDIVTGALLGRAVEPHAGEQPHGDMPELCLNCGTALVGPHCHQCGQAGHVHRTISAIGHDLLHGVVHFEGKLWKTLPMLAFHPGELTRRYIAGERARFVSPMALFLFGVFIMFAVFQIAGIAPPADLKGDTDAVAAQLNNEVIQTRTKLTAQRAKKVAARDALPSASTARLPIQREIDEIDKTIGNLPDAKRIQIFGDTSGGPAHTGWERLDHGIDKVRKNPSLALYKLQSNSYKFSWLLIPLSLPFVWLAFAWKRRFGGYDHAIFVIYSLAFMTLLFITLTVLAQIGLSSGWLIAAGVLIPPFHIYRQLKGAYGLTRIGALLRTVYLVEAIQVIALLFVILLVVLGLVG